jgi:hypothetical protein
VFAQLKTIALDAYDRIVGLVSEEISVDGCITKAPGGGECAGPSPVDRRKQGMKRPLMVEGYGHPPRAGCWPAPTVTTPRRWHPPWTASTSSGRCPRTSQSTWTPVTTPAKPVTPSPNAAAPKGEKAPSQPSRRWHGQRTNSWHNGFNRLQRCYERSEIVIDA